MRDEIDDREREPDLSDRATQREAELRDDAIAAIVAHLPSGPGLAECRLCGEPICPRRREALPGVETCVDCQAELDDAEFRNHRGY